MKDTNYAFSVARLRALENKLFTAHDISALIDQKSYDSAVEFLTQKGYDCNEAELEAIIRNESSKLQQNLTQSIPDKNELNALYIINDFFNLKAIVKCAVLSDDCESYLTYPTTIRFEKTSKPDDLFAFLSDDYRKVALEAYNIALKTGNGKFCDSVIDVAAIKALNKVSANKKSGLLGDICGFLADTANIKIAFRCVETNQDESFIRQSIGNCSKINADKLISSAISGKEALLDYLTTTQYRVGASIYSQKPSDFEKWCDDELIIKTKQAAYTSFGFDPVVSYYYRKTLEIKTVRMILNALKSDTDKNIIKERVRQLYA